MPAPSELTAAYRRQNLTLRAATVRDLLRLWPALDWRHLDRTYPAWLSGVSALIARDRLRSTDLSAAYLRAFRAASGVPGTPKLVLAPPAPLEQIDTVMRVSTVVPVKRATALGVGVEQSMRDAFVLASGEASKLALNAGRETITASTVADPRAAGWQRVGRGDCDFCAMLIGRGAVYSEDTATFEAHGHCMCSAEPVYR